MIVKKLTPKELDLFINFQYDLYENDENFRPELRSELMNFFTKNPVLKLANITFYLAIDNNNPVGRRKNVASDNFKTAFLCLLIKRTNKYTETAAKEAIPDNALR